MQKKVYCEKKSSTCVTSSYSRGISSQIFDMNNDFDISFNLVCPSSISDLSLKDKNEFFSLLEEFLTAFVSESVNTFCHFFADSFFGFEVQE